jgi:hypothetical protein
LDRKVSQILRYSEIEIAKVDRLLAEEGELLISLPPSRAKLCIAFIETVRSSDTWRRLPAIQRVAPLARGLWTTLKIMLRSPRLFELGRVVVLNASSQSWAVGADGDYLFTFRK